MFSPDFDTAAALLAQENPDPDTLQLALLTANVDYWDSNTHGTLLHLAARYDTLHNRKGRWARVLVEKYGFGVNKQGNEGSIPALWAISAYVYNEKADLETLKYLLSVASLDTNACLTLRGSLRRHLMDQFAHMPRLQSVLELLKRHRKRQISPLLLVRFRHRQYLFTR